MHPVNRDNSYVSTIVRHHLGLDGQHLLSEALRSLSAQTRGGNQVVVVLQNPRPEVIATTRSMLAEIFGIEADAECQSDGGNVWRVGLHYVISVHVPDGTDGRTRLLNEGIVHCRGRYLGFLDYDDILYPQAYAMLVETLQATDAAVAVGGAQYLLMRATDGGLETYRKLPFLSRRHDMLDFFRQNFIPFHTFIVDRERVARELIRFDERFIRAEDYVFLLRLATEYRFDLSNLMTPIAGYRLRDDGSNTSIHPWKQERNARKIPEWEEQIAEIRKLKADMTAKVNVLDLELAMLELERYRQLDRQYRLLSFYIFPVKILYRCYRFVAAQLSNLLGRA